MAVVINREALARMSESERSKELEWFKNRKRILEIAGDWHVSTPRLPDLATTNQVIAILESLSDFEPHVNGDA